MPCPWALGAAEYCRSHPDVDMGVHIDPHQRVGPVPLGPALDTRSRVRADGCRRFPAPHRTLQAQERADPEAVERETQDQVGRALEWGIDVTHIDTHMGTVAIRSSYLRTCSSPLEHRLPGMIPRMAAPRSAEDGTGRRDRRRLAVFIQAA